MSISSRMKTERGDIIAVERWYDSPTTVLGLVHEGTIVEVHLTEAERKDLIVLLGGDRIPDVGV